MKNSGFTLAETIITLGIIGVVAAMTIPTLSNHLRGKRLESQFKKTYSELNQAAKTFYADTDMPLRDYQDDIYGSTGNNSTSTLSHFMDYFKGGTNSNLTTRGFDEKYNIKNLNINNIEVNQYPCDKSTVFTDMVGRNYSMDDVALIYDDVANVHYNHGPKICVDINGVTKPNKWGVDRFVFVFTEDNAVIPYTGSQWANLALLNTDEKIISKYCNSTMTNVAHTCAYFALKNKSPEGNGDYWHDFLRGK